MTDFAIHSTSVYPQNLRIISSFSLFLRLFYLSVHLALRWNF
jgi:hypothetical protein